MRMNYQLTLIFFTMFSSVSFPILPVKETWHPRTQFLSASCFWTWEEGKVIVLEEVQFDAAGHLVSSKVRPGPTWTAGLEH